MKFANFQFSLGDICPASTKSLNPVSIAATTRNRKCFVMRKFFMEGDQIRVESTTYMTRHLSPSA